MEDLPREVPWKVLSALYSSVERYLEGQEIFVDCNTGQEKSQCKSGTGQPLQPPSQCLEGASPKVRPGPVIPRRRRGKRRRAQRLFPAHSNGQEQTGSNNNPSRICNLTPNHPRQQFNELGVQHPQADCKFYRQGRCTRGESCLFRHRPLCVPFLLGRSGEEGCKQRWSCDKAHVVHCPESKKGLPCKRQKCGYRFHLRPTRGNNQSQGRINEVSPSSGNQKNFERSRMELRVDALEQALARLAIQRLGWAAQSCPASSLGPLHKCQETQMKASQDQVFERRRRRRKLDL